MGKSQLPFVCLPQMSMQLSATIPAAAAVASLIIVEDLHGCGWHIAKIGDTAPLSDKALTGLLQLEMSPVGQRFSS